MEENAGKQNNKGLLIGVICGAVALVVAIVLIVVFVVKPGSKVTKKKVMDLHFPYGVNIGGMSRDGKSMLVSGATQLQADDKVVVFCIDNTLKKLDKFFK